jgi:hypothetical protein
VRMPLRLSRELDQRVLAIPQFANSVQRLVEVFLQSEGQTVKSVNFRPTSTRFDQDGKIDLNDAAEIMAECCYDVHCSRPGRLSDDLPRSAELLSL